MGLKKSSQTNQSTEFEVYDNIRDYINYFYNEDESEIRSYALEQIATFEEGPAELVELLKDEGLDHQTLTFIATVLTKLDPKSAPIDEVMELLKIENAFIRNLGITILQVYGGEIKYYIVKFLIGEDRDLRIFAINVLGDVNFEESREMMLELLESEEDINVAMTAVDYLAEIGEEEDIEMLEGLKSRFPEDPYAEFAIDRTVKMIRG
jgi:HEAT repeat protein